MDERRKEGRKKEVQISIPCIRVIRSEDNLDSDLWMKEVGEAKNFEEKYQSRMAGAIVKHRGITYRLMRTGEKYLKLSSIKERVERVIYD